MATYSSIIDLQQDPAIPRRSYTFLGQTVYRGPYQPPAAPASNTYTYEPIVEKIERSPPQPAQNFSAVKKRGDIVMTPYEHKRTLTRNYVVGCPEVEWVNPTPYAAYQLNPPVCYAKDEFNSLFTRWTEQGDSRYWSDVKMVNVNVLNGDYVEDVADAVATSQSSVIAAYKGGFDALTQLAESREALSYAAVKNDEVRSLFGRLYGQADRGVRDAVSKGYTIKDFLKSSDRTFRQFGARWMEYRYAIMPLFYAYNDVVQLIDNAGLRHQTFKSSEDITVEPTWPTGLPVREIHVGYGGKIRVTSTIRAGYSLNGLQSYVTSQTVFNPFVTALELIPLSFVGQWFVNVGDYIIAKTSLDWALKAVGCTAIRTRILREEILHDYRVTKLEYNVKPAATPCYPQEIKRVHELKRSIASHLSTVELDHYERVLFNINDAELAFYNDPWSWRRVVDAFVLSYRPTKTLLRSLK